MFGEIYKVLKYIMLNELEKEEEKYSQRHVLDKGDNYEN
jgi:hypothetical protein